MNKLRGFPTVYYVTLVDDIERQRLIKTQFSKYDITPVALISERFDKAEEIVTGKYVDNLTGPTCGCIISHLKAIKHWYENTDEDYGFFCEDDLSLETVKYWNFTWEEFVEGLPSNWDAVQLVIVREKFEGTDIREREWNDWAQTAYILKRDYAKKLLDSYIRENSFHLEIGELMPIDENILFTQGKTYSIPLFVENTKINSTDVNDLEIEDGQKPNHHYSANYILNQWRKMNNPLIAYAHDTENPEKNFNLARWYHEQGQTAAAVSFYLRSADRTDDLNLAYQCLIHSASCFSDQKNREYTVRGLYHHAITILPKRPEAYFLLARHYEWQKQYFECYSTCCIALNLCDFDLEPLSKDIDYPGKYGIIFEKAVSSYWWGKSKECRDLFLDLRNNYEMDDVHIKSVGDNLMRLGCWVDKSIKYEKSKYESFKYKFPGLEEIEKSNGQALQDMFVLSILNGRKNGTYLEIGAQEPFFQNNTALLETNYDWKGVSIEIKEDLCKTFSEQRKNTILCKDATTIDYEKLLEKYFDTNIIDYLQVDCEPSKTTFEILLDIPFDKYKFAVITYEHDHYVDMTNTYRTKSRNYLQLMGYELVVGNVSQDDKTPFEDWWVHPDLIDKETIERFKSIKDVTDVRTYMYSF
jgi:GR25 family glycosyltransferase involved in LPS biosynthesis